MQTAYLSFEQKVYAPTTWSMEEWHVRSRILSGQTFRERKEHKQHILGQRSPEEVRDLMYKRAFGMSYAEYMANDAGRCAMRMEWKSVGHDVCLFIPLAYNGSAILNHYAPAKTRNRIRNQSGSVFALH